MQKRLLFLTFLLSGVSNIYTMDSTMKTPYGGIVKSKDILLQHHRKTRLVEEIIKNHHNHDPKFDKKN